jgi:phage virion morphogenesis protein
VIALQVSREQLGAADRALERLSKVSKDLWSTMDVIGAYLVASTQRRFQAQTGPDGQRWIPSIRARVEGGQTLLKSGELMASIAHNVIGRDSVEVGSTKVYAAVQQLGAEIHAKQAKNLKFKIGDRWTSKPSVSIPARPYLGIDQRDQVEIEALVLGELEAAQSGKPAPGKASP